MAQPIEPAEVVIAWSGITGKIQAAIEGLSNQDLDLKDPDGSSIREKVHHLVEANIVAASIVIAGLGSGGCTFDWSWLYPDGAWTRRMGYAALPIGPGLETLRTLSRYLATILAANAEAPQRELKLLDAPGTEPRATTVESVLRDEIEHAETHLGEIREIRKQHRR